MKMTMKVKLILILIVTWDLWLKIQFKWTWRVIAMWLVIFGLLKVSHIDPFMTIEVEL